jgi:hypothetical protein
LIVIGVDEADALRPACRAGDIVCPVADCPRPALTARGGSRRDHFAHMRGRRDSHGPERLAHQHAKAVIGQWVHRRYPQLEVRTEATVQTGQRADVLVTSPSGKRVAVEIQCSPLTGDEWRERHTRYRDAGITVQWLWWNQAPHLRPPRGGLAGEPGVARRPALLGEIRAAKLPWLWFDPFNAVLPAAVADRRLARPLGCATTHWYGQHVGMAPFVLERCALGEAGIVHPVLTRLTAEEQRLAAEDLRRAEEAARASEQGERERREREQAARARFAALLARAPDPRHPALRKLLANAPNGGRMVTDDVCEGTLRLAAIADAGIVGRQATVWAVEAQIDRTVRIPSDQWDAVQSTYAALLDTGWVTAGRFAGSLQAPPGSADAAKRLVAANRSRRRSPSSTPRRSVALPSPAPEPGRSPPHGGPDATVAVGVATSSPLPDAESVTHRLVRARGPRLAIIETHERDGAAAALDVVAHVAACPECCRHRYGCPTLGQALVWARGPRETTPPDADVRLSALSRAQLDAALAAERSETAANPDPGGTGA